MLIRVLQPGFFAREDTLTPTWFAGVSAAINIVISLALFPLLQHVGIAIATSVAAWANAVLLAVWLHRRGHFHLPRQDWIRHGLIIVCSVVMGVVLWGVSIPLAPAFGLHANIIVQLVALAFLCGLGFVLYFVLVHITGAQPMGMLLKRLRRGGMSVAFRRPPDHRQTVLREIWFQRKPFGGWAPIHWKGFVLLVGGAAGFLAALFAATAVHLHNGPAWVVCGLAGVGAVTYAALMIVSFRHSRRWREREK